MSEDAVAKVGKTADALSVFYEWGDTIYSHHLPRWNELPEIELYMDQLVLLVGKYLAPYMVTDEGSLTATMVNNYVKSKMMPPPVRKRYTKPHIAVLVFICCLKPILSMAEIHSLLMENATEEELPTLYNTFCQTMERAYAFIIDAGRENSELFTNAEPTLSKPFALNTALLAGAGKAAARKLLTPQPQEESAKKK